MEGDKPFLEQDRLKVMSEELERLDDMDDIEAEFENPGDRFAWQRAREALRYCVKNGIEIG